MEYFPACSSVEKARRPTANEGQRRARVRRNFMADETVQYKCPESGEDMTALVCRECAQEVAGPLAVRSSPNLVCCVGKATS